MLKGNHNTVKIGLMGFESKSPNKGCEALTYALVDYLSLKFGNNLTISLYETEPGRLPELYQDIHFEYIRAKIKDPCFKWIRSVRKCDVILDITMGDSFSDIYSVKTCSYIILKKQIAQLFCKKHVLLPQTYGPFTNNSNKRRAIKVINHSFCVFSRDHASIEYLRKIGVKKTIIEGIDLAFMLPYDKTKYSIDNNRQNIGINVSGLLWRGGFTGENQFNMTINYHEYIRKLIEFFSKKGNCTIHLIAHVIDTGTNAYDDDYKVIEELHNIFPATTLAPAFDNPIDAKSYIANMDFFIGSRMHATIAAFCCGVPVVPVSYSRKFEGLFDMFGYTYLIHGNQDDTQTALSRTIEFVEMAQIIKEKIRRSNSDIKNKIYTLQEDLNSIFDGNLEEG